MAATSLRTLQFANHPAVRQCTAWAIESDTNLVKNKSRRWQLGSSYEPGLEVLTTVAIESNIIWEVTR
jgi:hypothetical protein